MVMIPVSHTGGREFKSLPIHFYFVAPDFRCYPALFMILKVTTLFSFHYHWVVWYYVRINIVKATAAAMARKIFVRFIDLSRDCE